MLESANRTRKNPSAPSEVVVRSTSRVNARERDKPRQQQASNVRTTLFGYAHVALTMMGRLDEARQVQDEVVTAHHVSFATAPAEFYLGDWDAAERGVAQ